MMSTLSHRPTLTELFTPKLVTVFKEGYGFKALRQDAIAGLTVAVIALPLSMAIAIASGLSPASGLYTAIVGGFVVSALGGSRFQIGGPAGAFIVLIASVTERHGYDGLVLATIMAGVMMIMIGSLRLGSAIKFIPYPVIVGFTSGIATIIFASQIKELLGLSLTHEPAAIVPKVKALWQALSTWNLAAVGLSVATILVIAAIRKFRPGWPGFMIAVVLASLTAWFLSLDVATIGSRYGFMPSGLPAPNLPVFSLEKIAAVWVDSLAIALLGSIESLLSAVVADGMSGRRHRSNCELVAQGIANIGSVIFGGICVTGNIARTATNVRSGAHGPVSGMVHSACLLAFMFLAAPLMSHVPLAALGAVLTVVCWSMAEKHEVWDLLKSSKSDRLVLLSTFGLTVFVDLVAAIAVGVTLSALFFMYQMALAVEIKTHQPFGDRPDYDERPATLTGLNKNVMTYHINGPFFFGAAAIAGGVLDRIGDHPKYFILDFFGVPFIDSSGTATLKAFVRKLHRSGTIVILASVDRAIEKALRPREFGEGKLLYAVTVEDALSMIELSNPASASDSASH